MAQDPHSPPPKVPLAPSQSEWEAMSPAQRERVVASLPADLPEGLMSPPEGTLHFDGKVGALDTLRRFFGRGPRQLFLAAELSVYYPAEPPFAPDVLAVWDVEVRHRRKWVVSLEGRGLDWVLEVHVGGDRKKDAVRNVSRYARLQIPEYFIYDRAREALLGYRLPEPGARTYVPIIAQHGLLPSQVLGLDLGLEDRRLRFYSGSARLLDSDDLVARAEGLAADAIRRADEEGLRAQEQALRAEEQALRAQEQALRAEASERRNAELLAELERLRKERGK